MGTDVLPAVDLDALIAQLQEKLRMPLKDIASTVGVDTATLYRWRKRETTPQPRAWSRLAELHELMQMLTRLFDGPDLAREWIATAKPKMLGGSATPLQAMKDGRIDRVLTVLHFLASGA